ncbi:MAG: acyl-CoA thioesterase [Lachnospiraceae bacterium]|nr:acyl-CoA thioesterase [Lachnospiraceae bacterium]
MEKYVRKVNYYETDKMGITHHSNYIRWMEEARIDYLDQAGMGYRKLEEDGVISAVIGIECEYKKATTFGDTVEITVEVEEYTGAKLILSYIMLDVKDRKIVFRGRSTHCFLNKSGRPVILRNSFPEFDAKLKEMAAGEKHEK